MVAWRLNARTTAFHILFVAARRPMVAVGFNPRSWSKNIHSVAARRLIRWHRTALHTVFMRRSATRMIVGSMVRGLKPAATIMRSRRDEEGMPMAADERAMRMEMNLEGLGG